MTFSSWPKTLLDLAQLGRELRGYSESGILPMAHVIGVISITFIWKHAWSIPGSVVWVRDPFLLSVSLGPQPYFGFIDLIRSFF
jgi:hypothetical protein